MILPPSWAVVLETLRPGFARRGTFTVFCVLAAGMVTQTSRRSVVGMLAGARMAQTVSFHAACRFFSHAVWDVEKLGLLVTRLIVDRLLGPDEAITVVIDETLFKRWGRKVHNAFWTQDGSAQGKNKIARGNCQRSRNSVLAHKKWTVTQRSATASGLRVLPLRATWSWAAPPRSMSRRRELRRPPTDRR